MATLGTSAGGDGGVGGIDGISSGNNEGATSICRRPELHVRCFPGEDMVTLYLDLHDNTAITLNRSRTDDIANTLRRLALTFRKRQDTGNLSKSGKKRLKAAAAAIARAGGAALGDDGGVTASLVSTRTGEVMELDGALNGDGWFRLCGSRGDVTSIPDNNGDNGVTGTSPPGQPTTTPSAASGESTGTGVALRIGPLTLPSTAGSASDNASSATVATTTTHEDPAADAATPSASFLHVDVVLNPPAVTSLECSVAQPMAGFALFARAEMEFGSTLEWEWLREGGSAWGEGGALATNDAGDSGVQPGDGGRGGGNGQKTKAARPGGGECFTNVVGRSGMYTPGEGDIGRRLMVRCTPVCKSGRRGRPVVRILMDAVKPGPEPGLLTLRRRWLQERGSSSGSKRRLRVVSYNILADMYCTSAQADEILYPYCLKKYREADYRMQLVLRELRGYAADLVMLQECELKAFERYFMPALEQDGFAGLYLNKAGSAQEGEALFFRKSAFTLESSHDFIMRDAISELSEFEGLLKAFPTLSAIMAERLTTVAQMAVLRPTMLSLRGSETGADTSAVRLIVANTHLYFHPNAAHIRLMQLVALAARVSRVKADLLAKGLRPAVILGGDLNSPPWGPVRYLLGELIGPESDLWENVGTFDWGDRFFDELPPETETGEPHPQAGDRTSSSPPPPTKVTTTSVANTSGLPSTAYTAGGIMDCESNAREGKGSAHPLPAIPVPYLRLHRLALELASGSPPFTNFTPSFTETLDYIFIDGGGAEGTARREERGGGRGVEEQNGLGDVPILRLAGSRGQAGASAVEGNVHVAPMPQERDLRAVTPGLPSETLPSDHVSLVVDLELCA